MWRWKGQSIKGLRPTCRVSTQGPPSSSFYIVTKAIQLCSIYPHLDDTDIWYRWFLLRAHRAQRVIELPEETRRCATVTGWCCHRVPSAHTDYCFCQEFFVNELQQCWCFDDFLEDFAVWISFPLGLCSDSNFWQFAVSQITLISFCLLNPTWLWKHPILRN